MDCDKTPAHDPSADLRERFGYGDRQGISSQTIFCIHLLGGHPKKRCVGPGLAAKGNRHLPGQGLASPRAPNPNWHHNVTTSSFSSSAPSSSKELEKTIKRGDTYKDLSIRWKNKYDILMTEFLEFEEKYATLQDATITKRATSLNAMQAIMQSLE